MRGPPATWTTALPPSSHAAGTTRTWTTALPPSSHAAGTTRIQKPRLPRKTNPHPPLRAPHSPLNPPFRQDGAPSEPSQRTAHAPIRCVVSPQTSDPTDTRTVESGSRPTSVSGCPAQDLDEDERVATTGPTNLEVRRHGPVSNPPRFARTITQGISTRAWVCPSAAPASPGHRLTRRFALPKKKRCQQNEGPNTHRSAPEERFRESSGPDASERLGVLVPVRHEWTAVRPFGTPNPLRSGSLWQIVHDSTTEVRRRFFSENSTCVSNPRLTCVCVLL